MTKEIERILRIGSPEAERELEAAEAEIAGREPQFHTSEELRDTFKRILVNRAKRIARNQTTR